MLLTIPDSDFHKAAVERKSQDYLNQLAANPIGKSGQSHLLEIIPYETLWHLLLDSLEARFVRRRGVSR